MGLLVQATPILVVALAVVTIVYWRRAKTRKPRALAAVAALFFLVTWPPVAWFARGSLEWWYSTSATPDANDAQAIVVLSGAVFQPRPYRPTAYLGRDTYRRCRHAAWLWREWRQLPVLVSGGKTDPLRPEDSLAAPMREYLLAEGLPANGVWIEDESRTTWENAVHSAAILREKGIRRVVLVTDAYHMPRSERCFANQGIDVVPAPCMFRAAEFDWRVDQFVPSGGTLEDNEQTLHEWIGLVWYWLRGRL